MKQLEKTDIQLGYIPLLDCTAVLWAHHQGYFSDHGLDVTLVKEPSWASLRDRLAFGFLDAAHCLSAMLPAAATGEDQLGIPLQTPLVLSTTRAFISLSQTLCYTLGIDPQDTAHTAAEKTVHAIQQGQHIQLAHVFKQSIHHYCLREWLALADADTAKKARLSALPPPYMPEAIASGLIDGFCVGEPWNTQAEIQGYGQIIAESSAIIPDVADKVLAVTQDWAKQHPNTLQALRSAIVHAQQELVSMPSLERVWKMLMDYSIIRFDCSEQMHVHKYHKIQSIIRSFGAQRAPNTADFQWIMQQMQRWDDFPINDQDVQQIAENCILT